jgi:hypothetical protein
MSGVFLASVIAALFEYGVFPPRVWSIVSASEVAAWRLKWVMLPVAMIVLWGSARIIRSIKASPSRFMGLRAARLGFAASALVTFLIAVLIGITMPVRLERRQWGLDAADKVPAYTFARALLEYRELHGTPPQDGDKVAAELRTLPDPDGSIAEALRYYDANGYRGSAIRNASMTVAPATDHGVSFTSYELRLPGPDKILNNEDDIIIRDGVVMKVSDLSTPPVTLTRPNAP